LVIILTSLVKGSHNDTSITTSMTTSMKLMSSNENPFNILESKWFPWILVGIVSLIAVLLFCILMCFCVYTSKAPTKKQIIIVPQISDGNPKNCVQPQIYETKESQSAPLFGLSGTNDEQQIVIVTPSVMGKCDNSGVSNGNILLNIPKSDAINHNKDKVTVADIPGDIEESKMSNESMYDSRNNIVEATDATWKKHKYGELSVSNILMQQNKQRSSITNSNQIAIPHKRVNINE